MFTNTTSQFPRLRLYIYIYTPFRSQISKIEVQKLCNVKKMWFFFCQISNRTGSVETHSRVPIEKHCYTKSILLNILAFHEPLGNFHILYCFSKSYLLRREVTSSARQRVQRAASRPSRSFIYILLFKHIYSYEKSDFALSLAFPHPLIIPYSFQYILYIILIFYHLYKITLGKVKLSMSVLLSLTQQKHKNAKMVTNAAWSHLRKKHVSCRKSQFLRHLR